MAIFMFGINLGHSYTICPAIEIILKDLKLKPTQIGLLGFVFNMCGIASGLMVTKFMRN